MTEEKECPTAQEEPEEQAEQKKSHPSSSRRRRGRVRARMAGKLRFRNEKEKVRIKAEIRKEPEAMEVKAMWISALRDTSYSICPNCNLTMEREGQHYCDRCGQKLAWNLYRKGKLEYHYWRPGNQGCEISNKLKLNTRD